MRCLPSLHFSSLPRVLAALSVGFFSKKQKTKKKCTGKSSLHRVGSPGFLHLGGDAGQGGHRAGEPQGPEHRRLQERGNGEGPTRACLRNCQRYKYHSGHGGAEPDAR